MLKQGTMLEERLGREATTRMPTRAQLRLAREFDIDIARFERSFRVSILKVLEAMGRKLEKVAFEVLETEKQLSVKDAGQDALDAALIAEKLGIAGIVADMEVVYETHYTRIMRATQKRINNVMDLGFFTTEAEAEILASGVKRVELLKMAENTKRQVFQQLSTGRGEGEAVAQLARRLREFIPAGRFKKAQTRATLIARTETVKAQQFAAVENYRQGGVTEVLMLDSRKGSFDSECDNLNGSVVSLAEGNALMNDEHPNGTRRIIALPPPILEDL